MLAINDSPRTDNSNVALFRLLLDNLPNCAAALYDDTLRVVCAGGELLASFDLGADVEGRHISELFSPQQAEMITRWFVLALNGHPMSTAWPNGEKVFNITVRPVATEYGVGPFGIVIVQDLQAVTAEQSAKLREEHQRASVNKDLEVAQTKSRLVERILHEFRNPLAAVASSADILEQYGDSMPTDQRRRHARQINQDALRIADILDDILTLLA